MQGNPEEEREAKGDTGRSYTTRKGRAAAVHNQSERVVIQDFTNLK